ncbi:MAG: hypothetical protein KQH63_06390 [Desulfobulbaceae bacterium]|nr:hypothetical protein [Desulfobulbaceae bacterium]
MSDLKKGILLQIFKKYEEWTRKDTVVCHKGCSSCCTQNVIITAVEGDCIYDFIRQGNREKWFAERLTASNRQGARYLLTMNQHARLCLERNVDSEMFENVSFDEVCPFVENGCCSIYPARPFSCRSLASLSNCIETGEAEFPEGLLVINTVTMQIIEHLGQKEYWGNMLDVLLAMADLPENDEVRKNIGANEIIAQAGARLLKAEPLTGFLLLPEEEEEVNKYMQSILQQKVGERTIDQIFNNR